MQRPLNQEMAAHAVELVRPLFEAMVAAGVAKRGDLHIVIMDPTRTASQAYADGAFDEDAILYEASFGDPDTWQYDFRSIARAKAFMTWRTGMPGHFVQQLAPHLLQSGDTKHAGSVVYYGLVVAASGVQSYYDEVIAMAVAAVLRGLCIDAMQDIMADKEGPDFFGDDEGEDVEDPVLKGERLHN